MARWEIAHGGRTLIIQAEPGGHVAIDIEPAGESFEGGPEVADEVRIYLGVAAALVRSKAK